MSLNDDLLWKLRCPSCIQWMIPPIYSCSNGHSVCNVCVSKPKCTICQTEFSNTTRNLSLENVIQLLHYPCKYKDIGCKEELLIYELESHLQTCRYRNYNCKLDKLCKWKGKQYDIAKHSIDEHDSQILIGNESTILWKSSKPEHEIHLVLAFSNLFYVHRKLKDNIMYWTIQYIGNSEDVILYCYEIQIFTDQFNNRKITFSEICHDDTKDDIDEIFETGFCVGIPMTIIETYKNLNEAVVYKITINKI